MMYNIYAVFQKLDLDPGFVTGMVAIVVALIGQIATVRIQSRKDKVEKEKNEQSAHIAVTEIAMSLVQPLQQQLEEQRLDNEEMSKKLKEFKEDLCRKDDEIYILNHQILELDIQVKDLKEINTVKDKQIIDMQCEIDSLRDELAEYRDFIEDNKLQFKRNATKKSSGKTGE